MGLKNLNLTLGAIDFALYLHGRMVEVIGNMNQRISQEDIRKIIISDMVKKRNSIVLIVVEDKMVYYLFVIPMVLLLFSYGVLKWIRSAFVKEINVVELL